jgi:hypothetical protein
MEVSCQFHTPTTLTQGKPPSMHRIGGWVGLRAGVDTSEKIEISCSSQKLRHNSSILPARSLISITSCYPSKLHRAGHFHCHCSEDMTTQWLDIQQIVVWFSADARNLSLIQSIQSGNGAHSVYIQSALRALNQGDKLAVIWSGSLIAYLVPRLRMIRTIHLLPYMPPCCTEGPRLSVGADNL